MHKEIGDSSESSISAKEFKSGSESPWTCASKIINDSPEGNALGWDPDGSKTTFSIDEPCYLEQDSTVLINVKDGAANFEVCNVDYRTDNFFEVFCDAPPSDGSELRYLVTS